ncbi:MAG: HflC protein [Gammaproteobacteria bacterium]|nr:MAG: HflC protein [Gammaproteobacteria bacterium]
MNRLLNNPLLLVLVAVLALLMSNAFFTVSEREKALKLRVGQVRRDDYQPGLHLKIPIIENVVKFDSRILTHDVPTERVLTSEKKNVMVDSFIKWRIVNPRLFYTSVSGLQRSADMRLQQFAREAVKDSFGRRTINQVVSSDRNDLGGEIQTAIDEQARGLGIEVVDILINKVELPEDVRESVFDRMRKDRAKIAGEIRSQGEESAKKIRASADRQREELLAEAYAQAEQTRGAGDATSARVYAEAYRQNPEFYQLYRSLSAYRNAFEGSNDVMLLEPDSEFFRYFNSSGDAGAAGGDAASTGN